VRGCRHPALAETESIESGDGTLDVFYRLPDGARPLASEWRATTRAFADVAVGIAAVAGLRGDRIACGPLAPRLVFDAPGIGGVLVAAGLWAHAYEHDASLRGATMTMRHFIRSPEHLGRGEPGERTETFFLAYALFMALTHDEPFPTKESVKNLAALRDGPPAHLLDRRPDIAPDLTDLLDLALSSDPSVRPRPAELATRLRRIATPRRRWWWPFS
jgi:hypothetical protein